MKNTPGTPAKKEELPKYILNTSLTPTPVKKLKDKRSPTKKTNNSPTHLNKLPAMNGVALCLNIDEISQIPEIPDDEIHKRILKIENHASRTIQKQIREFFLREKRIESGTEMSSKKRRERSFIPFAETYKKSQMENHLTNDNEDVSNKNAISILQEENKVHTHENDAHKTLTLMKTHNSEPKQSNLPNNNQINYIKSSNSKQNSYEQKYSSNIINQQYDRKNNSDEFSQSYDPKGHQISVSYLPPEEFYNNTQVSISSKLNNSTKYIPPSDFFISTSPL